MRIVRMILAPILLFLNWITTPRGVKRSPELQQQIDQQTAGLSLYQFKACPFCIKVRRCFKRHSLKVVTRDAKNDEKVRQELLEQTGFPFWEYQPETLKAYFKGKQSKATLPPPTPNPSSGWDMDTFLCNGHGRRLPLRLLANVAGQKDGQRSGIGIYPGKVEGYVWRIHSASLDNLQPPNDGPVILVADALDPGWVPYFSRVQGAISYVGGLLSHASIILRESRIPAITQLPAHIELNDGDWIEMDGQTGEVKVGKGAEV